MKRYKIVVEWYRSKQDIEDGKPIRTSLSGFSEDLTLFEANILKSKMPDKRFCGLYRINKIVESLSNKGT